MTREELIARAHELACLELDRQKENVRKILNDLVRVEDADEANPTYAIDDDAFANALSGVGDRVAYSIYEMMREQNVDFI